MPRLVVMACVILLGSTPRLFAEPPSPFELAQGLRDNNMADLAMELLSDIEQANPSADAKIVLPLERAKTRLAVAQSETDETVRDGMVALAKADFDAFLKNHTKHPRAAEASLSLARVLTMQAQSQLSRALRIEVGSGETIDPEKKKIKKASMAATLPIFKQAATRYGEAAQQLQKQLDDEGLEPARRRGLAREADRARLDRGITLFNAAESYFVPEGQDALDKAKLILDAKTVFGDLGKGDPRNSTTWVARAWVGACEIETGENVKSKETLRQVKSEGARSGEAGADGMRMAEFFEVQEEFIAKRNGDRAAVGQARVRAKNWLDNDRYRSRMTPQRLSVTYYYAFLLQREASIEMASRKVPAGAKAPLATGPALTQFREASREYKKLLEFENEYTDRATRNRLVCVKNIVGDGKKPPTEYGNFEEAEMAAMVRLGSARELDKADPMRTQEVAAAVQLFERTRSLIGPTVSAKDSNEALTLLAYAYQVAARPQEGALLAEQIARATRGPSAAKAGALAVDCYFDSRRQLDENDTDGRAVDRDRALNLGAYLERTAPTDPSTDAVRFRTGVLYFEEKAYRNAFDSLAKVTPAYVGATAARSLQGRAALLLLTNREEPLPDAERKALYSKAVADADAIPEPANPSGWRTYIGLRNVVAQLHLVMDADGVKKAETITSATIKRLETVPLPDGDKKASNFAADEIRLRSVYAQAAKFYKDNKFKECADRMEESVTGLEKAGPAQVAVKAYKTEGFEAKASDGDTQAAVLAADNLDRFRREIVNLALQARIREGSDKTADHVTRLFGLLEKLGGSVEATTDALSRLVSLVRPQIDELRKQGKADDAQKMVDVVSGLVRTQSEKPQVTPRSRASLGRSLRDMGVYDKAIEVLTKVPAADEALLKQKTSDLEADKRDLVVAFMIAQIELARAYRLSKQYDEADKILKAALGPDGKSGWAKSLEFKKEAAYLLEDKAADTPADKKKDAWGAAYKQWTDIIGPYSRAVGGPLPKEANTEEKKARAIQDREKLYPVVLDLVVDEKRCLARANSQLQATNPMRLGESLKKFGEQIATWERNIGRGLTPEVKARYLALFEEFPPIKDGYTAANGKALQALSAADAAKP
jgi:hypothetical protein